MTDMRDDELRAAFNTLNREVQASAPAFAELASPPRLNAASRRHRVRRGSFLIAAILIPAFIAWQARSIPGFDFERFSALTGIDPGDVTWKAPSDFLLSVPGEDLLRTIPTIDVDVPAARADSIRPQENRSTVRRSSDL